MTRFELQLALAPFIVTSLLLPVAAGEQFTGAALSTICVTPQGWCPAVKPGPSGAPCACQTASGWVQGVLK